MVVVCGEFFFPSISVDAFGLMPDFEPQVSGRVGAFSGAVIRA